MPPCLSVSLPTPGLTAAAAAAVAPCSGTVTGKIFVHQPHGRAKDDWESSSREVSFLNIQKQVTGLAAGPLQGGKKELLVVGTANELLAYNVEKNSDAFHMDMPHGVYCLALGRLGGSQKMLAFAGGNCSIMGVNGDGEDEFWTVTGDNVCSMALCDLVGEGENQLLVGSEDFNLRVFSGDAAMTYEFSETEAVTAICNLSGTRFAYALGNGSVGTYDGPDRSWRAKLKSPPVAITGFDMTMDGVPELVTAWADGSVDVRKDVSGGTGEVLLRDSFPCALAGLAAADYRMDGTETLLVVSTEGEARGYLPLGVTMQLEEEAAPADVLPKSRSRSKRRSGGRPAQPYARSDKDQAKIVAALEQRKQDMLAELRNFEMPGPGVAPRGGGSVESDFQNDQLLRLLTDECKVEVLTGWEVDERDGTKSFPHVKVQVTAPEDVIVRSMVLFAEGVFRDGQGESLVIHPIESELSNTISARLEPASNQVVDVELRILIAPKPSSAQLLVREQSVQIPKFALFELAPVSMTAPRDSFVRLRLRASKWANKIRDWVKAHFLIGEVLEDKFSVVSMRDTGSGGRVTTFDIQPEELVVYTPDMALAADFVQSLLVHLKIAELNTYAEFPDDEEKLREILRAVNEFQSSRQKLTADLAERSTLAKNLLFRAEDSRLLEDMEGMSEAYGELNALNRDLIQAYKIRCNNHDELLSILKKVNQHIQRAAKLRAGKAKTGVTAGCREAIKVNDVDALFRLIREGFVSGGGAPLSPGSP